MLQLTHAQQSAIQIAIHQGLDVSLTAAKEDTESVQIATYAAVVADPDNAAETLALAEMIDSEIRLSREADLIVDPTELFEVYEDRVVRNALLLTGVRLVGTSWYVGTPKSPNLSIKATLKLDSKILERWGLSG